MRSAWVFGFFSCLSLVWPIHVDPHGSFYSEILFVFGLILSLIIRIASENLRFFRVSGFSVVLFLLVIFFALFGFQGLSAVDVQFFSFPLIYALISFFSLLLGSSYRQGEVRVLVVPVLGNFLLAASILNFLIQCIQYFGFDSFFSPFVFPFDRERGRPFGNLGQPNLLATLHGVALCFLLWSSFLRRLFNYFFWIFYIFIIAGLALTFSRTAVVFFPILFFVCFLFESGEGRNRVLAKIIFGAFLFFCFSIFFSYLNAGQVSPSLVRVFSTDSSDRLEIWRVSLRVISSNFWFGVGFGRFTEAFELANLSMGGVVSGFVHHSHNFFLQIIAENGFLFFLIVFVGLLCFFYKNFKFSNQLNAASCLGLSVILVIFAHAQLEFPLSYAYFLIIFSFFIGVLDRSVFCFFSFSGVVRRCSLNIFLIILLFFSVLVTWDFRQAKNMLDAFTSGPTGYQVAVNYLHTQRLSLFASQREYVRFMVYPLEDMGIRKNLVEIRKVAWRHAFPLALVRLAVLESMEGNQDRANEIVDIIPLMYPNFKNFAISNFQDACGELNLPGVCALVVRMEGLQ